MNSLAIQQKELEEISTLCTRRPSIESDNPVIARPFMALHHLFWTVHDRVVRDTGTKTCAYFRKVFGAKRMERIATQMNMSENERTRDEPLLKPRTSELFIRAAEVYEDDLQELLEEIHSGRETLRYFTAEETTALRAQFTGVSRVDECSDEQIKTLMSILLPFAKIEHIFCNALPRFMGQLNVGTSAEGVRERAYTIETMRRSPFSETEWIMHLAKTLAHREIPEGVVLPYGQGGFCKVHKVLCLGGTFKYFIRVTGSDTTNKKSVILYRGTAPFSQSQGSRESVGDCLGDPMGYQGPIATYTESHALLTDPARGFVRSRAEGVMGIGMSLGGVHLQRDALMHRIERIVNVVGPGIDLATANSYAHMVNTGALGYRPRIEHYFEDGDICDQLGRVHLGFGCDPRYADMRVSILSPMLEGVRLSQEALKAHIHRVRQILPNSFQSNDLCYLWHAARVVAESVRVLAGAHRRNTLLGPHQSLDILSQEDNEQLQDILGHRTALVDPRWELLRQRVCSLYRQMIRQPERMLTYVPA